MKYVIFDIHDDIKELDIVTDKPLEYAKKFEPRDIEDGKMEAWDIAGRVFHFRVNRQQKNQRKSGNMAWLKTEDWQSNGAVMTKVLSGKSTDLKEALIESLEKVAGYQLRKKKWRQSKKLQADLRNLDFNSMSLDELVKYAELLTEPRKPKNL